MFMFIRMSSEIQNFAIGYAWARRSVMMMGMRTVVPLAG